MRCPKCGSRDDKVIDSRQSRDSSSIRRRRECLKCGYRFTTYEEIERSDLRVIKRDRTHEPFDRRKLAGSIAKAFEKRSTRSHIFVTRQFIAGSKMSINSWMPSRRSARLQSPTKTSGSCFRQIK